MEAMEVSNLESYTRKATDGDVTRYEDDGFEEVLTTNIRSRDPKAADELDAILQQEKKVRETNGLECSRTDTSGRLGKIADFSDSTSVPFWGAILRMSQSTPLKSFDIQEADITRTMQVRKRYVLRRKVVHTTKSLGGVVWILLR